MCYVQALFKTNIENILFIKGYLLKWIHNCILNIYAQSIFVHIVILLCSLQNIQWSLIETII